MLLSARQNVPRVGRGQVVADICSRYSESGNFLVPLALSLRGVARSPAIQWQADGIENGRLAAARRTDDAEDVTLAEDAALKVYGVLAFQ